jgi:pyruvate ferredoxin oxidoreductase alpha subunit
MTLMAFKIAEKIKVPFMVNLDGFRLTHTYEALDIPDEEQVKRFLPDFVQNENCIDLDNPRSFGFGAGPDLNAAFHKSHHEAMTGGFAAINEIESEYADIFGRSYTGGIDCYKCDDAEYILITLGSVSGLCRLIADSLRDNGIKAGILRIRYMRPFPDKEVFEATKNAKAVAVLEKDISFGGAGTVFTNVKAAAKADLNIIGGLGGADISAEQISGIFSDLINGETGVKWL